MSPSLLPPDNRKDGFDNDAAHLQVSPSYLDQYLVGGAQGGAAGRGQREGAAGEHHLRQAGTTWSSRWPPRACRAPARSSYIRRACRCGTRGGISFVHDFPAAGEYALTIGDLASGRQIPRHGVQQHRDRVAGWQGVLPHGCGRRARPESHRPDAGKSASRRSTRGCATSASRRRPGQHTICGHLPEARQHRERGALSSDPPGRRRGAPGVSLRAMQVRGPMKVEGFAGSASRRRRFSSPASRNRSPRKAPLRAARSSRSLAQRAFRRPVNERDAAATAWRSMTSGFERGGFETGVRNALAGHPGKSLLPLSHRRWRCSRHAHAHRCGAGLAAVLLPVGQHS